MATILFEEAIKLIDSGEIVTVEYISYDKQKRTGGKLNTISGKVTKPSEERTEKNILVASTVKKRNHHFNFTRLIRVYMGDRETAVFKPIHLPLLLKINDKRVLL